MSEAIGREPRWAAARASRTGGLVPHAASGILVAQVQAREALRIAVGVLAGGPDGLGDLCEFPLDAGGRLPLASALLGTVAARDADGGLKLAEARPGGAGGGDDGDAEAAGELLAIELVSGLGDHVLRLQATRVGRPSSMIWVAR